MTSAMMSERSNASMTGVCRPTTGTTPNGSTMCVVPRCRIECEDCTDGCKIYCACDEQVSCGTLQNLCRALAGDACCVVCTWNGTIVCQCNFTCGHCRCEMSKDGACITCTSGDKACCKMIKSMCDAINCCLECGCSCTLCFGTTPVCCSVCC